MRKEYSTKIKNIEIHAVDESKRVISCENIKVVLRGSEDSYDDMIERLLKHGARERK
jgi:hypothetical protein